MCIQSLSVGVCTLSLSVGVCVCTQSLSVGVCVPSGVPSPKELLTEVPPAPPV